MLARTWITLLSLSGVGAAASRRAASPSSLAFLDLDEFDPVAAVKGIPGAVRDNLRIFRVGTGAMWRNRKAASVVRKRVKQGGAAASYSELLLLRKSGDDAQKLLQAGVVYLAVPELLPAMLYFFPRSLPSTFETDQRRARRYETIGRLRSKAVLQLLTSLEEDAATKKGKKGARAAARLETAKELLRAGPPACAVGALAPYLTSAADDAKQLQRSPLKRLEGAALKAGCGVIGLSGPLPGFVRRSALRKHLQHVAAEDDVLAAALGRMSRDELLEACFDRGLGAPGASVARLRRELSHWLALVRTTAAAGIADAAEPKRDPDPARVRLAALSACAVSSTRAEAGAGLPKLLYAKSR